MFDTMKDCGKWWEIVRFPETESGPRIFRKDVIN